MPTTPGPDVDREITDETALREIIGHPYERTRTKEIDHVDPLARRFIAAAPFAVLTTRRADGGVDLTPRGDPAGFALVLDDKTIALPERPGNRRADALKNILHDPRVGLLFIIPGHGDTIRVGGTARIVQDAALAERMTVRSHRPDLIILIRVERLLSHCPKAFIRSSMWKPDGWPDTSDVPTLAELMVAHSDAALELQEMADVIAEDRRTRLY